MPILPRLSSAPVAGHTPEAPRGSTPTHDWGTVLGRGWRVWLVVGAMLVFAAGATAPLADSDLGIHLRVGEWISTHGRVPMTEPFAWTRPGAAYYAYSWLAEVGYYAALRVLGPLGLHLLHGAEMLGGAAAVWALARARRLAALPSLLLVLFHVAAVAALAPNLRPHVVLTVAVPLAWVATTVLVRRPDGVATGGSRRGHWWPYAALFAAAGVAANTHLLAPVVAAPLAPLVALLVARGAWRRFALASACVAGGLAFTPYAAHWVDVYRLNFAPNALFNFPSPIGEHLPGAVAIVHHVPSFGAFALWLALLPWLLPNVGGPHANGQHAGGQHERVERALLAALWVIGLTLFALAIRGLLIWWLVSLPLTAAVLARVPAPSRTTTGRVLARAPFALPVLLAVRGVELSTALHGWEGWGESVASHRAVAPDARAAVALADTLDRLAPLATGSRVLTTFNYGNALVWRLPRLSMSSDGRTIFPDSAARLDGYVLAPDSARIPSVAGSAELAILPLRHVIARRLTEATGWHRIAVARVEPTGALYGLAIPDTAGLWVTDRWAARWMNRAPTTAARP